MGNIIELKDSTSTKCYPLTKSKAVYFNDGSDLESKSRSIQNSIEAIDSSVYYDASTINSSATSASWKLIKETGLCAQDSSYKIVKYNITSKQYIRVEFETDTDTIFQFQNSQNVPGSGTSNRIGITYCEWTGTVCVPSSATWLIISCKSSATPIVYEEESQVDYIPYILDEIQKYSNNGLARLSGFWKRGNIYQGNIVNISYRALSQLQCYNYAVTLSPVEPSSFRYFYATANADGTVINGSPWYTDRETTIDANTYFYVCVARITENTSERIDLFEFASKVVIQVGSSTDSLNADVVTKNIDQEQIVYNLQKGRSTQFADVYSPLVFIHFSDIHRATDLWGRICDYMDKYSSVIPFALHTGDYVKADQTQYTDLYALRTPKSGYILNCVGNHDTYETMSNPVTSDKSTVYTLLFNHIDNWGVTWGASAPAMYYYKDFSSNGIRLIVVDQYYWDATQQNWFVNTLSDAITNDLSVVTAGHVCSGPLPWAKRVDCTFTCHDEWTQGVHEGVIDQVPGFDTLIKNFVNAGGEHVCHLGGHFHHDVFGYTANDILNINIECATNDTASWAESERNNGTKAFDCFNVMSIDKSLGYIRIVRIGNNVDYHGRIKNILTYDYRNKRVITNT